MCKGKPEFDYTVGETVTYHSNQGTAVATVETVLPKDYYHIEYVRYDGAIIRKRVHGGALAPHWEPKSTDNAR